MFFKSSQKHSFLTLEVAKKQKVALCAANVTMLVDSLADMHILSNMLRGINVG